MGLKSAVITGATSFIGNGLVRRLLAEGIRCTVLVRPESKALHVLPPEGELLRILRADAADTGSWKKAIGDEDVFFHFAWDGVGAEGRANPAIQRRNVEMSLNCLRTAAGRGVRRFLFAGSQAEYGIRDGILTEDTACAPVTEYGKGKLRFYEKAQEESSKLNIEYAHLRIFSVYGPGDHPWTLVNRCIECFRNEEEMALSECMQLWNFLYITDAAEAIRDMADAELAGLDLFNIAGEETKPLKQYVNRIWELCGKKGQPMYGKLSNSIEKPHGIEPDIHRMQTMTGWKQKIGFEDGIRQMIG